jgi:hypothetical protein
MMIAFVFCWYLWQRSTLGDSDFPSSLSCSLQHHIGAAASSFQLQACVAVCSSSSADLIMAMPTAVDEECASG